VFKAAVNIHVEVFVVDNASSDDSKSILPAKFPQVHFKWNSQNIGFAKANNSVLNEVSGSHILFLNPDTIIPENGLESCLQFFQNNPDAGALGVHMIDGNGRFLPESKRGFPSAANAFFKLTNLYKLFPSSAFFSGYYSGHIPEKKTASIEVLSGAFFMISNKMLKRIGGFDPDYFMYGEDIDLSYRVKKTGFKNYYFPEVSILHFKGESTSKNSAAFIRNFYGAMLLFIDKHIDGSWFKKRCLQQSVKLLQKLASMKLKKEKEIAPFSAQFTKGMSVLIVANQSHFNAIIQLLKDSQEAICICGRVAAMETDSDPSSGLLSQLDLAIKKTQANAVLFCESPELSYFRIIDAMKANAGAASFIIHSEFSSSFIASEMAVDCNPAVQ
jgi:GT2 family glycosyltransferase